MVGFWKYFFPCYTGFTERLLGLQKSDIIVGYFNPASVRRMERGDNPRCFESRKLVKHGRKRNRKSGHDYLAGETFMTSPNCPGGYFNCEVEVALRHRQPGKSRLAPGATHELSQWSVKVSGRAAGTQGHRVSRGSPWSGTTRGHPVDLG